MKRIIRRTRYEKQQGYLDKVEINENVLQIQKSYFFGLIKVWEDLDVEFIPTHVIISMGVYGDTGGWKSKFFKIYPELFR